MRGNRRIPGKRKARAGFSPAEGFCILDMALFSCVLETVAICTQCKRGKLQLKTGIKQGFCSQLLLECTNHYCGQVLRTGEEFYSSKRLPDRAFEVNRRMVLAGREVGIGRYGLQRMTAVVGMVGGLTSDSFSTHVKACEIAATKVAEKTMEEAATQLRLRLRPEPRDVDSVADSVFEGFERGERDETDTESDTEFEGFPSEDKGPTDVAVSCDGTWQKRGHQSLYGVQAIISAATSKVLDYEIQSKHCQSCQWHANWDKSTKDYKDWIEKHEPICDINYAGSANHMEAHGAEVLWGRSLEGRNLRYTVFIGDGDSSSFRSVINSAPYGDVEIIKSDCVQHVQKRMGSALRKLVNDSKGKEIVPPKPGCAVRKGIHGMGRLTSFIIDKLQNYYGLAINRNLGDVPAIVNDVHASYFHLADDHKFCPIDKDSWCKFQKGDGRYKPKNIPVEVLSLMEPVYDRLSDPNLLERVSRGESQNTNEALHSIIWRRCPKHIFCSPEAIGLGVALAVIHRNVGNIGIVQVLEDMGIHRNAVSLRLLENLDKTKEASVFKHRTEEYKKRRLVLRGRRKKKDDKAEEKEGPSYQSGAFGELEPKSSSKSSRPPSTRPPSTRPPSTRPPSTRPPSTRRSTKRMLESDKVDLDEVGPSGVAGPSGVDKPGPSGDVVSLLVDVSDHEEPPKTRSKKIKRRAHVNDDQEWLPSGK